MVAKIHHDQLRNSTLFRAFPDGALIDLAGKCHYLELPAGATLFRQGDPSDALYILEEGQIHVIRSYDNGDEVIIATEVPYYAIGDLSMLAGQPRTGGVVAVSDSTLIEIERTALLEVCERIPEVASEILSHLAQRLYRMNLTLRENAIGNVAARVASVILLLADDKNGMVASQIRVSRLARAVAVEADVVDRVLTKWCDQGLIVFDGHALTVNRIEAIRTIAG